MVDELTTQETPPPPRMYKRWVGRFYATYLTARWTALLGSILLSFVVVTALAGGWIASTWARVTLGVGVALVLPWLLRGRLRQLASRRLGRKMGMGGSWFFVVVNASTLALLCFGFCDETGRALRRRGDWFLGEADGWLPRRYRASVGQVGRYLERFDLPPEARTVLADAAKPQPEPAKVEIVPPENFEGPLPPPPPKKLAWYHPLAGPRRMMPPSAGCRFGAYRPGRRPKECELGHCGVDLLKPTGTPIYAVYDGTIKKLIRDEKRGKLAGKFVVLSHKDDSVFTSYVHLHTIPPELKVGMAVTGGKTVIGTVGTTGTKRSAPHLHFAVSVKRGKGKGWKRYIDPEPLLLFWRMVEPEAAPEPDVVADKGDEDTTKKTPMFY